MYTSKSHLPSLEELMVKPDNWQFEAAFHMSQLNRVRKNLGKQCLYLSHEKVGDKRFIKAVMTNNTKGKDTVRIQIDSNLSMFKAKEYDNIQQTLGERIYERNTETV